MSLALLKRCTVAMSQCCTARDSGADWSALRKGKKSGGAEMSFVWDSFVFLIDGRACDDCPSQHENERCPRRHGTDNTTAMPAADQSPKKEKHGVSMARARRMRSRQQTMCRVRKKKRKRCLPAATKIYARRISRNHKSRAVPFYPPLLQAKREVGAAGEICQRPRQEHTTRESRFSISSQNIRTQERRGSVEVCCRNSCVSLIVCSPHRLFH